VAYAHELASKKEKAKNDKSIGATSSNAGKFTSQKYVGKGREAMYIRWEGRVGRFDEMESVHIAPIILGAKSYSCCWLELRRNCT
jgi:hypothetical protein